jgi:MFS family permease
MMSDFSTDPPEAGPVPDNHDTGPAGPAAVPETAPERVFLKHRLFVTLVGAVLLMEAIGITTTDIFVPFVRRIAEEVPGVGAHPGDLVGLVLLGEGIGALFWGFLFDRFGFRRIVIPGCLCYVAAAAIVATTHDYTLFAVARLLHGVALSWIYVIGYAMIRYYADARLYTILVNLMTGFIMILPPLAVALAAQLILLPGPAWREISGLATLGSVLALTAFMFLVSRGVESPPGTSASVSLARVIGALPRIVRNDYRIYICVSLIALPSIAWVGALVEDPATLAPRHTGASPGSFPAAFADFATTTAQQMLAYPANMAGYARAWAQGSVDFLTTPEVERLLSGANVDLMITVFLSCLVFAVLAKVSRSQIRLLSVNVVLLVLGCLMFWRVPMGLALGNEAEYLMIIFPLLVICFLENPTSVLMEGSIVLNDEGKGEYGTRLALAGLVSSAVMYLYLHFDDRFIFYPGFNGLAVFFTVVAVVLAISYVPVARRYGRKESLAAARAEGAGADD